MGDEDRCVNTLVEVIAEYCRLNFGISGNHRGGPLDQQEDD